MSSVSFIKFDRQSFKWARFGTVADQSSEFRVLFWFKVESREFSCHAFIGFLMGLFIGYRLRVVPHFSSGIVE